METKVLKDQKKKLGKAIGVLWLFDVIVLAIVLISSVTNFSNYKKGQKIAVEYMLSTPKQYEAIKDDYDKMVKMMYDDLNVNRVKTKSSDGYEFDNTEQWEASKNMNLALGRYLKEKGYECTHGSDYLECTNMIDYVKSALIDRYIIWIILSIIIAIINIIYCIGIKKKC